MAKGRFRGYFLRGLAVLLPTVLTIWLIVWGFNFINDNISLHIKKLITFGITRAGGSQESLSNFWISAALSILGFIIALVIVYVVGVIIASVFGKAIWRQVERFIMNTPLLKQIYPFFKQITDVFLSPEETKKMFSQVVAVEYPRKGIWSVGLVTGSGLKKIADSVEKEFLTIFIATTPSPLTGFVIIVPKDEVVELDMSLEDAFRFLISAGLILPASEKAIKGQVEKGGQGLSI
jgi:uncharacterized membrane protein